MESVGPPGPEMIEQRRAAWMRRMRRSGPPDNVMPVAWPVAVLLARTDKVALSVLGGQAYPNGVALRLIAVFRGSANSGGLHRTMGSPFTQQLSRGVPSPDQVLRFGVRFADGRAVTNLDDPLEFATAETVDESQPRLGLGIGGGGNKRWDHGFFLSPLPPDGQIEFVAEWPVHNIPETRVSVDVTGLSTAGRSALELWPEEEERTPAVAPRIRLGDAGEGFFRPILPQDDSPATG